MVGKRSPTDIESESKAIRRPKRKPNSKAKAESSLSNAVTAATSPDPAPAVALVRSHKCFVTIYTLLSTRPHVTITFDKLAPTITAQLGHPFTPMDVARFKVILGGDELLFHYRRDESIDSMNTKNFSKTGPKKEEKNVDENEEDEILLVELRDVKLQQTPSTSGAASVRMPTVRQKDMVKAIERRVTRFRVALNRFIDQHGGLTGPDIGVRRCWEDRLDIEAARLLPASNKSTRPLDPVQAMLVKSEQRTRANSDFDNNGTGEPFNFRGYIDALKQDPAYQGQIVPGGEFTVPAQAPVYAENTLELLGDALQGALDQLLLTDANLDQGAHARLYSHQADALAALFAGKDVVVSTSTSSGKSLIYQLPILKALWEWHKTKHSGGNDGNKPEMMMPCPTAIFIFPTKALAQDQMRSFNYLKGLLFPPDFAESLVCTTYDGDTSVDDRLRNSGRYSVVFTNPDMLHVNVLPNWERPAWHSFLAGLKYVVLDELHMYQSGSFGMHVSLVLRRLRRIADHCAGGNTRDNNGCLLPPFQAISCSATISHPDILMQSVFGLEKERVCVVANDGSPAGVKHWLVWNSPYITPEAPESGRVHPIQEATRMLADLTMAGVRTIAFCPYRRTCELLMKSITAEFDRRYQKINNKLMVGRNNEEGEERREPPNVMAYRGGYSASDRRLIEHEMFAGRLAGVVATNALELGIDIGALDAVLMVGFPLTVASLRQQAGRAGRRASASLAVLFGGGDPLDQHCMANPHLVIKDTEGAQTAEDFVTTIPGFSDNESVFEEHMQCTAFEIPINFDADQTYFTSTLSKDKYDKDLAMFRVIVETRLDCVNETDVDGTETKFEDRYYTCDTKSLPNPARQVALRGSGGRRGAEENYSVIDLDTLIVLEEIEPARVSFTLYEGGVFIHQGCTYLIKSVEPEARYALVMRHDGLSWITRQRDYTDVDPAKTLAVSSADKDLQVRSPSLPPTAVVKYGLVLVATVVYGFFKLTTTTADGTGAYSKIIDAVELPEAQQRPYTRTCAGLWIDLPRWLQMLIARDKALSLAGAIHAAEHAVLNALGGGSMASSGSTSQALHLATECKAPEKEFKRKASTRRRPARLIFYDTVPVDSTRPGNYDRHSTNTATAAWAVYAKLGSVLARALSRLEHCPCPVGCPECGVTWGACTENNQVVSKPGALMLLRYLNSPLAADDSAAAAAAGPSVELLEELVAGVPDGPEENLVGKYIADTII